MELSTYDRVRLESYRCINNKQERRKRSPPSSVRAIHVEKLHVWLAKIYFLTSASIIRWNYKYFYELPNNAKRNNVITWTPQFGASKEYKIPCPAAS